MSLVDKIIKLQPVFIDTAIFIYLFEDHPRYAPIVQPVFDALSANKLASHTSILTVAEVLTKPMEKNNLELKTRYQEVFNHLPNLSVVSPVYSTAILAASIRATYRIGLIDSFQLALASENGCRSFLTNDRKLSRYKKLTIVLVGE